MRSTRAEVLTPFTRPDLDDPRLSNALAERFRDHPHVLAHLRRPVSMYTLRVNTLKVDPEEVVEAFEAIHPDREVRVSPYADEVVEVEVLGPEPVEVHDRLVVADKFAAESVYVGADLYKPGVIDVVGDVGRGDRVTVVSERGHVVAEGVARVPGREMVEGERGPAVRVTRSVFSAPRFRNTEPYAEGWIYSQALPSVLAVKALDPEPGWTVVDACAAPGGKTTHVVQIMEGEGRVVAIDRSRSRLEKLEANVRRLGMEDVVEVVHGDARKVLPRLRDVDAVIVDPPCTAVGVRPKLWMEATWEEVLGLPGYQYSILRAAVEALRDGGYLLYCTCTLTPMENEAVVSRALMELDLELEDRVMRPGRSVDPGVLFDPRDDVPGFYYCVMRKG